VFCRKHRRARRPLSITALDAERAAWKEEKAHVGGAKLAKGARGEKGAGQQLIRLGFLYARMFS
jgi:hypothetical protein